MPEKAKKRYERDKKNTDDPEKVLKTDEKREVIYAEIPKKYNNIFKHIIVFTNDKDTKNNKTLKNIEDAVKRLKKYLPDELPSGQILGKVTLVDCIKCDEKFKNTMKNYTLIEKESGYWFIFS